MVQRRSGTDRRESVSYQQRIISRFDFVLVLMIVGFVLDIAQSVLEWLGR